MDHGAQNSYQKTAPTCNVETADAQAEPVQRVLCKKLNYVPALMRKLAMQHAVHLNMFKTTEFKGDVAWERVSTAAAR